MYDRVQKSFGGMKSRLILTVVAFFSLQALLFQPSSAFHCKNNQKQNSYLWKIESTPPVYLYGTMHVPYKKVWDAIPENVKRVFSGSQHFCVELRLTDSDTLKNLSKCRFLPKNQQIKDVLPQELYTRITKYLVQVQKAFPQWIHGNQAINGFDKLQSNELFNAMISGWNRQRPIWLLMLLSSLSKENIKERSIPLLDIFMDKAAENMGKSVEAMENFKEQCRPFNRLNKTQVTVALRKQLDYLEPLLYNGEGPISTTDADLDTYHCGDFLNLVKTTSILPLPSPGAIPNLTNWEAGILKSIEDYLHDKIILRRNRRMTKKICSLLQKPRNETYLFALGAGHFLGTKSIVHMLQKKKYQVRRVPSDELINGPPLPNDIVHLGDPSSKPKILKIPTDVPTIPTTAPPDTLPTLSPHVISQIMQKAINSSTKYKVDSLEVFPSSSSPSPSPSPSQSPQQRAARTSSKGLTAATDVVASQVKEEEEMNTSSSVRWSSSYTTIIISLTLVSLILSVFNL